MNTITKNIGYIWKVGLVIALILVSIYIQSVRTEKALGSVMPGGEYTATSTGTQAGFPNYRNALRSDFRSGYGTTTPGTLGSVVITNPGTSRFCLHDATSTATNAENLSGTTTIACFGASAPAGTYTFDMAVQRGVLVEYISADTVGWASTTVTFRR